MSDPSIGSHLGFARVMNELLSNFMDELEAKSNSGGNMRRCIFHLLAKANKEVGFCSDALGR